MGFGSVGISELVIIFIIVLVFFGPRRFPEIARSMGSAMREFRRSLNQIQRELEEVDPRKDIPGRELLNDIRSMKSGKWLDPNQTRVPEGDAGASRSPSPGTGNVATPEAPKSPPTSPEPQRTGESAGSAVTGGRDAPEPRTDPAASEEQLPMFEGGESLAESDEAEPRPQPDTPPTDDSRSG
jgi:TatA/E family protein of Tat protein translocase